MPIQDLLAQNTLFHSWFLMHYFYYCCPYHLLHAFCRDGTSRHLWLSKTTVPLRDSLALRKPHVCASRAKRYAGREGSPAVFLSFRLHFSLSVNLSREALCTVQPTVCIGMWWYKYRAFISSGRRHLEMVPCRFDFVDKYNRCVNVCDYGWTNKFFLPFVGQCLSFNYLKYVDISFLLHIELDMNILGMDLCQFSGVRMLVMYVFLNIDGVGPLLEIHDFHSTAPMALFVSMDLWLPIHK